MLQVIDTATSQRHLDFGVAFSEGFRDCYVKMGGDNVDTYVAPWYKVQVDRARAARFEHVGHYWVPDGNPDDPDTVDTPTQQADWMVDRLHDFRPETDFIVLDNEALDGGWMLTDAGAAEFVERVKARKGIPGRQVFMYGGWYDLAGREWPQVLATGAMFIVADYRAASQPGMNFPDIPTIPRDRIVGHQYGGRAIGGVITDTNTFVDDAFDYGGEIVTLEQKARAFAARYPTSGSHPSGGDNDWDQDCGRVCYRFASSIGWSKRPTEGSVYSAYAVAMASGWLNTNAAAAPVGAWHFWDIAGPANGHVGVDLTGGGRRVFMGTWSVAEDWGRAIGVLSVSGYTAAKAGRARYLGWATNYAGGTVNLSGLAGLGTTPIGSTPVPEEDEDMKKPYTRIQAEGRGIALIAPGYYRHLMNSTEVEISAGFVDRHETVSDAQFDYLVAISIQGTSANSAAEVDVLERIKNLSVKAEIPADFAAQVAEGTAAAVESKLADDFAAIDVVTGGGGPTAEQVAGAVREEFRKNPLQ